MIIIFRYIKLLSIQGPQTNILIVLNFLGSSDSMLVSSATQMKEMQIGPTENPSSEELAVVRQGLIYD